MKRRLLALCMAMCMIMTIVFPSVTDGSSITRVSAAAEENYVASDGTSYDGYVYFTVERITLGQGFVVEPCKVGFDTEDNLADITRRLLGDAAISTGSSFYLSGVVDGGEPDDWSTDMVPEKITQAIGSELYEREEADTLSAFDYYDMSGWMFSLNNQGISAGADSYSYKGATEAGSYTYDTGDVVRLQFTLYGYGADTNMADASWGTDPLIDFPDKDELIKAAADYEGSHEDEVYKKAIEVLSDWDADEEEIAEAVEGFEADTDTDDNQGENQPEEQTVAVTISMNAVSTTMKLYDPEGEAVEVGEPENKTYSLELAPGDYTLEGFGTDGTTSNGTIVIHVGEEESQSFNIFTVTAYCSDSTWVYGTDFIYNNLGVYNKAGQARKITLGNSITSGRQTFLVLSGDTYELDFTPAGEKAEEYAVKKFSGTATANANKSMAPVKKAELTITVPYADTNNDGKNDYILEAGTLSTYYIYSYLTASNETVDGENETETLTYDAAASTTYFYRVTNPYNEDAVTYGNFVSLTGATDITVTKADLYVDVESGTDYDKHTVIGDTSVNAYDVADIYLNVNEKGYLELNQGDTYDLYPLRNWLAIEGISNAKVIEPDFHYTVLDTNGNASDSVVTVTENLDSTTSRHKAVISANGKGTAIILVTYDAMTNAVGYKNAASSDATFFSGIWPENTGVIVVNVGGEKADFDTGMTINAGKNTTTSKLSGDYIDAEADVLYYTDDAGASYTFTPETGVTAEIAVPVIADTEISYNGFASTGVSYGENGSITLTGLKEGANIVRLTKGDQVSYQIIRAKKVNVTYTAVNADGETVSNAAIAPGDTVTITFDTLYHPLNKISGYYNFTAKSQYTTSDGETVNGGANQYLYASTATCQQIKVNIPDDYTGSTYNLTDGLIYVSGYGSEAGSHRSVTYEKGKPADFTALSRNIYLCSLPDISIPVSGNETKPNGASDSYGDVLSQAAEYLHTTITNPTITSIGGEWAVLGLARYGITDRNWYNTYYENVVAAIKKNGSSKLSSTKSTENSRVIIALTSIGANPENIGGYNLLEPLSDMSYVTKQGINGAIFGLIAIDSGAYEIPAVSDSDSTQTTREGLVNYILDKALADGGWCLTGNVADVDITAMAVQALAPYYQQEEVKEKVDAALSILSESQLADGSFSYKGTGDTLVSTAESTAQVITALCSLGINPETDERFVKQGNSAVDALIGFYDEESNSFCHTTQPDAMATEQAVYALVSYDRLLAAKNTLYDMADRTDIYSIKPATPALGNISNQKAGIRVTWKTVSNAEGYYVYRKTTGGSYKYLTRVSGGSSWYYTDTTAVAGSTYTYTVRAYRKSTLSGYVAAGSTIKRLAEPVPVVTNTASGIHISWNQIKGATGYYVYRKAGNATKWSRIATIKGAAVVSYQDTGVSNGVKYIYTVRAVSGTSLSSYYAGRVIYRLSRETVRTISNSGAGKISLTWTKYLSAGYYQIQYSTSSSMTGAKTINTSSNGVISTTISGLTKGKTYYVRIRCVKSAGGVTSIGAWSQIRSVKVSK